MACDINCKKCAVREDDTLSIIKMISPFSAEKGSLITIGCTIRNNSYVYKNRYIVCLYDDSGCIKSEYINEESSSDKTITWAIPMIDKNYNLHISVIYISLYKTCNDWKDFQIKLDYPIGTKFTCTKSGCVENPSGYYTNLEVCEKDCSLVSKPCDPNKTFPILGECIPKSYIFLGVVLGAIYLYKR